MKRRKTSHRFRPAFVSDGPISKVYRGAYNADRDKVVALRTKHKSDLGPAYADDELILQRVDAIAKVMLWQMRRALDERDEVWLQRFAAGPWRRTLQQSAKRRRGAFLLDQQRRIQRARGVIHRHHQSSARRPASQAAREPSWCSIMPSHGLRSRLRR
jgi:hypothetical protein